MRSFSRATFSTLSVLATLPPGSETKNDDSAAGEGGGVRRHLPPPGPAPPRFGCAPAVCGVLRVPARPRARQRSSGRGVLFHVGRIDRDARTHRRRERHRLDVLPLRRRWLRAEDLLDDRVVVLEQRRLLEGPLADHEVKVPRAI